MVGSCSFVSDSDNLVFIGSNVAESKAETEDNGNVPIPSTPTPSLVKTRQTLISTISHLVE